jgi:hypothetical protein
MVWKGDDKAAIQKYHRTVKPYILELKQIHASHLALILILWKVGG